MPGQQHSQPTPASLAHGACILRCNMPPAFWQNDRNLLRAIAVIQGGTDTE